MFSRSDPPFYGFTILNRKSLSDNVIEVCHYLTMKAQLTVVTNVVLFSFQVFPRNYALQ